MAATAARNRAPRVPRQVQIWALRAALLAVVLGAWVFATRPGGVSPLILPQITTVAESFVTLLRTPDTWWAAAVTVYEMLAGFALATVTGLGAGFLLSRTRVGARAAEPVLAWGYMFPFALLYPLFLIWVGVGVESKILYAAAGAFFPIAYNTIRGLRSVDQKYLQVGKAFGASAYQIDVNIKLGAARPMILSGLRIGSSIVTIYVVLAELLGSNQGLGHEIEQASSRLQIANSYGTVLLLILVTTLLQVAMERLLKPRHE
jgi:ABC-type nitrate/sulfonate/bicarbonate transport system permease component